jgi:hypothetical protein
MNKFQEGKIYVIKSPSTSNIYIGATTQPLNTRFSEHKCHYKRYIAGLRNYTNSYDIIKLDDAFIELLEEYKCNNKQELLDKEKDYITKYLDNAVNRQAKRLRHLTQLGKQNEDL